MENTIPALVDAYRKLKAQADSLDAQMKEIKDRLEPLVIATGGKWDDESGYAKMISRKPSVSFSSSDVEKLASAWLASDDPIMNSCGQMLAQHRQEKSAYQYIQIK